MGATLKQVNARLSREGIPLELERDPAGYHYFIFDRPDLKIYETESEYIPYTSHVSVDRWIELARTALETIRKRCADHGQEF